MHKPFAYFKDTDQKLAALASFYSEGAIVKYLSLSQPDREASAFKFILEINRAAKSVYSALYKSLISGDYIFIDLLEKRLERLKAQVNRIVSSIPNGSDGQDDFINKLLDDLQSSFSIPVLNSLSQYRLLISQIKYKLSPTKAIHLIDVILDQDSLNISYNSLGTITFDLNQLFALAIQLAKIDHNIAVKKEYLEVLLVIQKKLEKAEGAVPQSISLFVNILIDKCNYLLFKILYRLEKDKKSYLYTYEYKDKEIKIEEIKSSITYYIPFLDKSVNHYSSGDRFGPYYEKAVDQINDRIRQNRPLKVGEYHTLINFYKDKNKSYEQVDNLVEEFIVKYKAVHPTLRNPLDSRSYSSAYNYILNNRLSLSIYKNKYTEEFNTELEKKLSEISIAQQQTHIKNYFPYYRVCNFLVRAIRKELDKDKLNQSLIKKLLQKLEKQLETAFENFEWCKDKDFLPYQLPRKECTLYDRVFINGESLPVFLASSFILPINYEQVRRDLESTNNELNKLRTQFELQTKIDEEKTKINSIRTEIGQHDRKQIEILSIFAAIVLFAIGNIQLYNNVKNFDQAMMFMIAFAYALGLFVICIWVVTRYSSIKITLLHWAIFASYLVFTGFLFYSIKSPKDYNYPIDPNKKKGGPTSTIKVSSDSLEVDKKSSKEVSIKF